MKNLLYLACTALYFYAAIASAVSYSWGWLIVGLVLPPVGIVRGLYLLIVGG